MAHFAQLDENNIVTQVIVVHNNETHDEHGVELEALGIEFCKSLFGADTKWIQTSYNGSIRHSYAGVGYMYDNVRDAFIPPRPYDSWLLNEESCLWEAPILYPTDGNSYEWDDRQKQWTETYKNGQ